MNTGTRWRAVGPGPPKAFPFSPGTSETEPNAENDSDRARPCGDYFLNAKNPRTANANARSARISGWRSGIPADTITATLEVLFAAFESELELVTVAEFVITPGVAGAAIVSVTIAVPPLAIVPREQLTDAVPVHVPCDGTAERNDVPAGMLSVTVTPVADAGPEFATTIV
jgi:hypothetical protein